MKKIILITSILMTNIAFSQTNNANNSIINSTAITDYLTSASSQKLKSALGMDFETQAYTKVLDGLFNIWKNTFSEANSDMGQVIIKLYDNMKNVLQGLSFDIKTEKYADGLVIKTLINYPYQQGLKKFNVDYFMRKEGNFWKVYDVKIGGLDVLPLYKIINK